MYNQIDSNVFTHGLGQSAGSGHCVHYWLATCFEIGLHEAQSGLELIMKLKMALSFGSSCLHTSQVLRLQECTIDVVLGIQSMDSSMLDKHSTN